MSDEWIPMELSDLSFALRLAEQQRQKVLDESAIRRRPRPAQPPSATGRSAIPRPTPAALTGGLQTAEIYR